MKRTSFRDMRCPIARGLEHVGEWWSILILRDALKGLTRFDDFRKSLGIASNMLTRRLQSLVDAGLLDRRQYQDNPPRHEYLLTKAGNDFLPVLVTLYAWGSTHFPGRGHPPVLTNVKQGTLADPVLVDRVSGKPITAKDYRYLPDVHAGDAA